MKATIPGVSLLERKYSEDERGVSIKCQSVEIMVEEDLERTWDQTLFVSNRTRHTLRGMHWQEEPHGEVKLVQCLRGRIFDVMVDLRKNLPSYGTWYGVELSGEDGSILRIPEGIAHGYLTLEDETELLYHISGLYRSEAQRVLCWNDPAVGVCWPEVPAVISERDASAPMLSDL
ncbi:MAG: dTDP-4-dehydrorhamnose 3,5-epimerase family protein [Verrucomicrobiota bacterium]